MPARIWFTIGYVGVLSSLFAACAGQEWPGGGPPDSVPPSIIRTVPDTNAVRVETDAVELEFSEYVDRRSVEESIFISPYPGELEFDWSGTEVSITFSQSPRTNTTYVVNVGTDVKDIRAGNRMASGFTLAFSTGDSIDHGVISGRVFDDRSEGVMIFAYGLLGIDPDTLDPSRVKPDYIMQTGKGGTFTLSNIAFGTYRVFAVRDEYRDLLYQKEIDRFGVTHGDVTVNADSPGVADVWFRMSTEDTTRPFLTSVRALDRFRLLVRFSESLDSLSFPQSTFTMTDTVQGTELPSAVRYLARSDPAIVGIVTARPMDSAATYRLRVHGVFDRAGNQIDSAHAWYVFAGTNTPDTLKPVVTIRGLSDSAKGYALEKPIEIEFSKPVDQFPLVSAIALVDSSNRTVTASLGWRSAVDAVLTPMRPLLSKAWYEIRVQLDSVMVLHGPTYKDSTYHIRFQTMDLRATGSIEGTVIDEKGGLEGGLPSLTATSVDAAELHHRTVVLDRPGPFVIDRLPEGRYVVSSYRDQDSSGTYTVGQPFPFKPSERFAVYPDTIKVRVRWSVEGVVVRYR